ncbi:hypothetical protein IGI37_000475 [Enterococcus sp. AZ194]|uniref:hypothetical protein n=1 Tax=Enterococcus sp. AZ194 TaxID=2774629 RepID=UPI003F20500A
MKTKLISIGLCSLLLFNLGTKVTLAMEIVDSSVPEQTATTEIPEITESSANETLTTNETLKETAETNEPTSPIEAPPSSSAVEDLTEARKKAAELLDDAVKNDYIFEEEKANFEKILATLTSSEEILEKTTQFIFDSLYDLVTSELEFLVEEDFITQKDMDDFLANLPKDLTADKLYSLFLTFLTDNGLNEFYDFIEAISEATEKIEQWVNDGRLTEKEGADYLDQLDNCESIEEIQQLLTKIENSLTKKASPLALRYSFSPKEITAAVGKNGTITIEPFNDIELKGTFAEVKDNPYIELSSDGTWKALKTGETTLMPIFTLSKETIAEIQQKYPGQELQIQEIQQIIPVKISAAVTEDTTPKDSNKTNSQKKLPQTNDRLNDNWTIYGGLLLVVTFYLKKRLAKN